MKNIKFRIWDGKRFWYWGYVNEKINGSLVFTNPPQFHTPLKQEEMQERSQQFTGLKDKNGKEIFEGDILRAIYSKSFGKNNVWYEKDVIVEVEEGYYGYEFKYKVIREVKRKKDEELLKNFDFYAKFLVIGNQFENPELLKIIEGN